MDNDNLKKPGILLILRSHSVSLVSTSTADCRASTYPSGCRQILILYKGGSTKGHIFFPIEVSTGKIQTLNRSVNQDNESEKPHMDPFLPTLTTPTSHIKLRLKPPAAAEF